MILRRPISSFWISDPAENLQVILQNDISTGRVDTCSWPWAASLEKKGLHFCLEFAVPNHGQLNFLGLLDHAALLAKLWPLFLAFFESLWVATFLSRESNWVARGPMHRLSRLNGRLRWLIDSKSPDLNTKLSTLSWTDTGQPIHENTPFALHKERKMMEKEPTWRR
jgi:hypothetical protein